MRASDRLEKEAELEYQLLLECRSNVHHIGKGGGVVVCVHALVCVGGGHGGGSVGLSHG